MPRSGFVLRQVGFCQSLGQIAANTNFFVVRYKARDRLTVLQKHKRNVLIVRTVNAVRKVARSFRDGYALFFHNLIIRLSVFPDCVSTWLGESMARVSVAILTSLVIIGVVIANDCCPLTLFNPSFRLGLSLSEV